MNAAEVEAALSELESRGECLKRHATRQVWRLSVGERAVIVKFYPHRPNRARKLVRGSLAMYEFTRLQWLQKARIPAPRAIAALMGFRIGGDKGDAVVMEAIEPAERLDLYLHRRAIVGLRPTNHREIAGQIVAIVAALRQAGLGHPDLHLGNFMISPAGAVSLIDAYPLRRRELSLKDLYKLALSVRGVATRSDIVRAWRRLQPAAPLPTRNPLLKGHWRKLQSRIFRNNAYFQRFTSGDWSGAFFRKSKYPRRGSAASALEVTSEEWSRQWPELLGRIEAGDCQVIKRSPSGEVLATEVTLGSAQLPVIIKRPRRKKLIRFINEIGRGTRSRRAWVRSWSLLHRELPTAWPLILMERRRFGYVIDQIIVYERVPGDTLSGMNLDKLSAGERQTLFHRLGSLLRRLEESGLSHWDAKSTNWMIRPDAVSGPSPVMIDVDGIRGIPAQGRGILRLLETMREHPQYTPMDSLHLCRGYAPFGEIRQEPSLPEEGATGFA